MAKTGFSHESPHIESNEWYTPKSIFDALDLEFDLDPCSPGAGLTHVPARTHYSLAAGQDGLALPWNGLVFMNPPYGRETGTWMRRLKDHGNGIGLVFARTDVTWFHEVAPQAGAICFISGRIKFHKGHIGPGSVNGTPGAGSMMLGFGDKATQALLDSGLGLCMRPM